MSKNKTKGGYIHGIYVSAKTRNEFKRNKEQFKAEGIKSSYSLQKQKNIATKMLRMERETRRKAIAEAYKNEEVKFKEIGYNLKFFLEKYQQIEEYNQKIKLAIKQGKILSDTPLLSFPINWNTGKINLERLKKVMVKTKQTISDIRGFQYNTFYTNVREVFGSEIEEIAREALAHKTVNEIYEMFSNDIVLSPLVNYAIEYFNDDMKAEMWDPIASHVNYFLDMLEDARRGTR